VFERLASARSLAGVFALLLSSPQRFLRASILLFLSLVQVHQWRTEFGGMEMIERDKAGPECMSEIGGILALGLTRLMIRKSSQKNNTLGESFLHLSDNQSACGTSTDHGEKA
jgi:hypothetical protein